MIPKTGVSIDERLRSAIGALPASSVVAIGDVIPVDLDLGFLRGHGTVVGENGQLRASVCGVVERINKLVSVRPLRSRYVAETGDVVVGRIVEVAGKRWKVDVGAAQDGQLQLSAVNLAGGIQRRRTAVDELNMRSLFCESDIISAEVQSVHQDGSLALHTRSLKYGKLECGQLVKVPPYLIKRMKQHFCNLPAECGAHLILGCNGYVWVSPPPVEGQLDGLQGGLPGVGETSKLVLPEKSVVGIEARERVCRAANAVRALAAGGLPVYPASIQEAIAVSLELHTRLPDMLALAFVHALQDREATRREKANDRRPAGMDLS